MKSLTVRKTAANLDQKHPNAEAVRKAKGIDHEKRTSLAEIGYRNCCRAAAVHAVATWRTSPSRRDERPSTKESVYGRTLTQTTGQGADRWAFRGKRAGQWPAFLIPPADSW
jgi:hypothetical protein